MKTGRSYFRSHRFPGLQPRLAGHSDGNRLATNIGIDYQDWSSFWRQVSRVLRGYGYQRSTLLFYRQVLRSFSKFVDKPPCEISRNDIKQFLTKGGSQSNSSHWTAMSISVMRTIFDKLGRMNALVTMQGPRRTQALPESLTHNEVKQLMAEADTLRDQLIIALLYGCGLKLHELQALTWNDLDANEGVIILPSRNGGAARRLTIPTGILPILLEGYRHCSGGERIFPGRKLDRPLSARIIQLTLRKCAEGAGIDKFVTPMALRHSFAVHHLRSGVHIRKLQLMLDHKHVETTLRYMRCLWPGGSDADAAPINIEMQIALETMSRPAFPLRQPDQFFRLQLAMKLRNRFLSHRGFDTG